MLPVHHKKEILLSQMAQGCTRAGWLRPARGSARLLCDGGAQAAPQHGREQRAVLVVGHAAAVVALANHVLQCGVGHLPRALPCPEV